jgi:hypothetical protein
MQMVVNISKKDLEYAKDYMYGRCNVLAIRNTSRILGAIADGIELPKEHGRLIDADEFHHTLENMPIRDNDKWFNWLQKACNRLAEAPTIIEADRYEDGEKE